MTFKNNSVLCTADLKGLGHATVWNLHFITWKGNNADLIKEGRFYNSSNHGVSRFLDTAKGNYGTVQSISASCVQLMIKELMLLATTSLYPLISYHLRPEWCGLLYLNIAIAATHWKHQTRDDSQQATATFIVTNCTLVVIFKNEKLSILL